MLPGAGKSLSVYRCQKRSVNLLQTVARLLREALNFSDSYRTPL